MKTLILAAFGGLTVLVHDPYGGLRDPVGRICCSGDKKQGDCEAVTFRLTPEGDAVISSRRYGADVLVARDRIVWSPVPGSAEPAHWCGVPRARATRGGQRSPVDPDNPDPGYLTLCAFIDPGSS